MNNILSKLSGRIFILSTVFCAVLCTISCTDKQKQADESQSYFVRMADSEMARNPESWMLDFSVKPKWNYCHGLVLQSIGQVWEETGNQVYFDYMKSYADTMIDQSGIIATYKLLDFNIDRVNSGKILFPLYAQTKDERYKIAMDSLLKQMYLQPRTSDGGFWHKKIYPHQMWLDGLYMASPFLAQYAETFDEPALFDEVAHQILTVAKHTYDPNTGLYYHGWDESREQEWADPETGKSPNFWSRSIGWYMMAIVDVLDFLPENHPQRPEIIQILKDLSASLAKYQDPETQLWYQVTDKMAAEGNYLESSASAMFIYTWAKAAQKGYLDEQFLGKAETAYQQFILKFVRENQDGTISVTDGCSVAGLGGNPYRSGTYEYYISEPVRDDDPKATGPFIMASILLKK